MAALVGSFSLKNSFTFNDDLSAWVLIVLRKEDLQDKKMEKDSRNKIQAKFVLISVVNKILKIFHE